MAVGDKQKLIIQVIEDVLQEKAETDVSASWLKNKHLPEDFKNEELNLDYYPVIDKIFLKLGGNRKGLESKQTRALKPDCYFRGNFNFLFEFDELQHFTSYKLIALENYPSELMLGFDISTYKLYCKIHKDKAIKKGPTGYRKPKEEFPFENGRAAQRAFFDAFRDILPPLHGLNPTLRITEFEVKEIFGNNDKAKEIIKNILTKRGVL